MTDKFDRDCQDTKTSHQRSPVRLSKKLIPLPRTAAVLEATTSQQLSQRCERLERQLEESETQLRFAQENLSQANLELQKFANAVSHDLQTPLRAISGFSQFLQQEYQHQLDGTASGYIDRVVEGAARTGQLVEGLTMYSRLTSEASPFDTVDLNEVVANVLAKLERRIRDLDAVVTVDTLPTVFGDSDQLTLLIRNLIDNSLKFRSPAQITIRIEAEPLDRDWRIAVQDNGIGIPQDRQECVFTIFRRLNVRQAYEGIGAGLAICRRIVDRHSGKIWLRSSKNEGCTVYFTIPSTMQDSDIF